MWLLLDNNSNSLQKDRPRCLFGGWGCRAGLSGDSPLASHFWHQTAPPRGPGSLGPAGGPALTRGWLLVASGDLLVDKGFSSQDRKQHAVSCESPFSVCHRTGFRSTSSSQVISLEKWTSVQFPANICSLSPGALRAPLLWCRTKAPRPSEHRGLREAPGPTVPKPSSLQGALPGRACLLLQVQDDSEQAASRGPAPEATFHPFSWGDAQAPSRPRPCPSSILPQPHRRDGDLG